MASKLQPVIDAVTRQKTVMTGWTTFWTAAKEKLRNAPTDAEFEAVLADIDASTNEIGVALAEGTGATA